jgi:hypothetical protein
MPLKNKGVPLVLKAKKFSVFACAFETILTNQVADGLVFALTNKTKGTLDRMAWAAVPDVFREWPVL